MKALNIPVGISNFEKIRNNGFYYVDKTGLIEELLKTEAEVTLITRPRRFGKTLGMSMLESFFDIRKNSRKLFEGLEIARQSELCSKWMNHGFRIIPAGGWSELYKCIRYADNGVCRSI